MYKCSLETSYYDNLYFKSSWDRQGFMYSAYVEIQHFYYNIVCAFLENVAVCKLILRLVGFFATL